MSESMASKFTGKPQAEVNPTSDRLVQARALSYLDLEFLERVSSTGYTLDAMSEKAGKWCPPEEAATDQEQAREWTGARLGQFSVVIAYEGELGISMGVVRQRYPAGTCGFNEDHYEVSPFPGAWERVPVSRIVSVRATTSI